MQVNSAQIKRDHVLALMMEDGFGPDEVLANAAVYAKELTGRHQSPTAMRRIAQIARSLIYPRGKHPRPFNKRREGKLRRQERRFVLSMKGIPT